MRIEGVRMCRLAVLGVAVGGVLLLGGCASAEPAPEETVAVESPTPTPEPTVNVGDLEFPANLAPYEAMSVEEFEALPWEERMSYVSWLNRDKEEFAGLVYEETQAEQDKYPGPASMESSNQVIVTTAGYGVLYPYLTHFNVTGVDGGSVLYDEATSEKMLSGAYADTTSVSYFTRRGDLREYFNQGAPIPNPAGYINNGGGSMPVALNEDIMTGTEKIGDKEYPTRTVQMQTDRGNVYTVTYAYTDYVNYAGETEGTWAEVSRTDK